jgi:SAM-dependent methyltransferase
LSTDLTQRDYWDAAASTKAFTHPLDLTLLAQHIAPDATILDYGCGQGRLCGELQKAGYAKVVGVDFSEAMVQRARQSWPGMAFAVLDASGRNMPAECVDCVLLFAVLTCIPDDASQRAVVDQLERVLKPGGIVYISDYLLQSDPRSVERYQRSAAQGENLGVFVTDDGARVRHHSAEWLDALFAGFQKLDARDVEVMTMNGHRSGCCQWVLRMPSPSNAQRSR